MSPSGSAKFIWDLAGGEVTEEKLNFILDDLPFCQALAFWHCKKWGIKEFWTISPNALDAQEATKQAARIVENIRQGEQSIEGSDFDPDLSDEP